MPRRAALAVLAALTPSAGRGVTPRSLPACRGCSVLLVSIDTLRADELGLYGYPRPTSPNLDALAKTGVVFLDAYSHVPDTRPSNVSLFTSQYPWVHGVQRGGRRGLAPNTPTLASVLRAHGYLTAWAGTPDEHTGYVPGLSAAFNAVVAPRDWKRDWNGALDWIDQNRARPFFLFLHTWSAQSPYMPSRAAARRFLPRPPPGVAYSRSAVERRAARLAVAQARRLLPLRSILLHPGIFLSATPRWDEIAPLLDDSGRVESWKVLDHAFWSQFDLRRPRDRAAVRAIYDASVFDADRDIGRLLRRLRRDGLTRRTLIVICSDHGEAFGEHGTWRHGHGGNVYSQALHIPLIFAFPGGRPRRRVPGAVQTIDVSPTILAALGLAAPASFQGRSLLPLMAGRGSSREWAFSRWRGNAAARGPRYDCVFKNYDARPGYPSTRPSVELYQRAEDPGERDDLAARKSADAAACEARAEAAFANESAPSAGGRK